MLDKRYQVFISTSGLEMLPERMLLSQTLIGAGFFSWGLEQRSTLSSAFTRRQIDESQYFIVLLGSQYGELSISGLSYIHVEYNHARSLNKPIIVLMHEQPELHAQQRDLEQLVLTTKFQNFRAQLQRETEHIVYYRSLRDLEVMLRSKMSYMLEQYPTKGWVREQELQQLQMEIQRLKAQLIQQSSVNCVQLESMTKVAIHDEVSIDYKIHAYQDGNFKELQLQRTLTWAQLLLLLGDTFKQQCAEEYFAKSLNHYLNTTGLAQAQQHLERVHAVARAQIHPQTLYQIKLQMRHNDWIKPTALDERQRELWKVTQKAQKLIESNVLDINRVFQLKTSN